MHAEDKSEFPDLQADLVDGLAHAGLVDPLPCIACEHKLHASTAESMFPGGAAVPQGMPRLHRSDPTQYAKLALGELRSSKLAVASHVKGGGGVFVCAKRERGRQ